MNEWNSSEESTGTKWGSCWVWAHDSDLPAWLHHRLTPFNYLPFTVFIFFSLYFLMRYVKQSWCFSPCPVSDPNNDLEVIESVRGGIVRLGALESEKRLLQFACVMTKNFWSSFSFFFFSPLPPPLKITEASRIIFTPSRFPKKSLTGLLLDLDSLRKSIEILSRSDKVKRARPLNLNWCDMSFKSGRLNIKMFLLSFNFFKINFLKCDPESHH